MASIYDRLTDFLRAQRARETLTFRDISKIIDRELPDSAQRPQFWANTENIKQRNPANNAVREAGYKSFLIAGSDKVRFERC